MMGEQLSENRPYATMAVLTAGQLRTIEKIATTTSLSAAAREAKVAQSTIWKWMKEPAFREALADVYRQRFDAITLQAAELSRKALATLEAVLDSPTAAPGVKVQAANAVLAFAHRSYEIVGVTERLDRLEGLLESGHGQT
jgi:molybdenum-dependent DNA-binding transcriptional regulator ModE